MIPSKNRKQGVILSGGLLPGLATAALCLLTQSGLTQQSPSITPPPVAGPTAQSFQGSLTVGQATDQTLDLTLDDAIQRGLKNNLGVILSATQTETARGQRLSQLQSLLPTVDGSFKDTVTQVDLATFGLRFPGIPNVIGPFGYQDLRGSLNWSLINVNSLRTYLASRHNFNSSQLSAEDARDMVVLTVGNAYLLVIADESQISSVSAQVVTSKVSLDQAVANHDAGTAPMLDELRARVDYQQLQQQLIVAQNSLEKDKLALARTIGLPLAQKINLADKAPYQVFDELDVDATIRQAHANRKDLAAMLEQVKAAEQQRKAATADRFPTLTFAGDYGDIGTNLSHSHGTEDLTGTVSVPLFAEFALRGEAQIAQSTLDTDKAKLSDQNAQVDADLASARASSGEAQHAAREVDRSIDSLKQESERHANDSGANQ